MADGADPRRAGDGRTVAPLTAEEEGIGLRPRPRFGLGNLQSITDRFGPLREDVAAGPGPASRADVVSRRRRRRHRRSGAGSQASSSADGGGARDPGPPAPRWVINESGQHLIVGAPSHRLQSLLSQASSSAAPSSEAEGRIRVRQSVLYSDSPRHSRPRRLARAEASAVRSSELHRPVMDLPTIEALSLGDPSLSTPETVEMTNVDYAPRSEQEEHTCAVNSSEVDREVIEEALSLSDPPLLTPQTETDEESTDDDCAWVPTTRQTELFFNRPKGISRSMVLSEPLLSTIPNVKEQRPKLYSDVDPKDVQRMVKEYLDACPCINLDIASDSILAVEEALNARAAELGTEPQLPSVITEQTSLAAAHPQHSMVPTESRHEASAEEIIPNGTAWMNEEVMLCFKKFIDINRHLAVDSKAIATLQPCHHIQDRRQPPTFFLGGIRSSSSQGMYVHDNTVKRTIENPVPVAAPAPASVFGGKNLCAPWNVEEDHKEARPLSQDAMKIYEHLIGVHVAYFQACNVPKMTTSRRPLPQVVPQHNTDSVHDAQVSNYRDNLMEADTTLIQQQTVPSVGSYQVQHYGASGQNNKIPCIHQGQMVAPVTNPPLRLMHIKGQVAASCADANGSHFVLQAIEVATPQEIVMVYEEIMPYVRMLAIDVFGNHAVQKILEHGPQSCKRELISRLIGHVLPLSRDMYGCRVIEKALEVGENDQRILIAKELRNKVLKSVRDQFANHVIQKCVECLPPNHIQFIFRSFCGRVKALSTHHYGSRVIQKVLAYCDIPEVYHKLTAEIIEFANKLSADAFGNYVVQYLLEHGGQAERSMIVRKFDRRVVSMCYHKFASNVLEKCLVFGSQEDRQLIIDEILGDAGSQHFDHLVDMMINPYANFVIQKMLVTAEAEQVDLLLYVARNNAHNLKRYPNGRHVIAAMESLLSAMEGRPVLLVNNEFGGEV